MKRLYFIIAICLLFISCFIKKQPEIKNKTTARYPEINNESEVFDMSKFQSPCNEIVFKGGDTIFVTHMFNSYSEFKFRGRELKEFHKIEENPKEIFGYDYTSDSIFGVFKQYYLNGILEEKGVHCCFGFDVGKWYYYDEKGKLIKTINYDVGYWSFNTDALFDFCKENLVPLKIALEGRSTTIHKITLSDGTIAWSINYPRFDLKEDFNIVLDAANGKVLTVNRKPFMISIE